MGGRGCAAGGYAATLHVHNVRRVVGDGCRDEVPRVARIGDVLQVADVLREERRARYQPLGLKHRQDLGAEGRGLRQVSDETATGGGETGRLRIRNAGCAAEIDRTDNGAERESRIVHARRIDLDAARGSDDRDAVHIEGMRYGHEVRWSLAEVIARAERIGKVQEPGTRGVYLAIGRRPEVDPIAAGVVGPEIEVEGALDRGPG